MCCIVLGSSSAVGLPRFVVVCARSACVPGRIAEAPGVCMRRQKSQGSVELLDACERPTVGLCRGRPPGQAYGGVGLRWVCCGGGVATCAMCVSGQRAEADRHGRGVMLGRVSRMPSASRRRKAAAKAASSPPPRLAEDSQVIARGRASPRARAHTHSFACGCRQSTAGD